MVVSVLVMLAGARCVCAGRASGVVLQMVLAIPSSYGNSGGARYAVEPVVAVL